VTVLALVLGAALGAPARYLLDRWVQARLDTSFPWGLVVVNLLGSAVLGVVTGVAGRTEISPALLTGVATGWCGAFTTYSSFGYEAVYLVRERRAGAAVANVLITVLGGLMAVAAGVAAGQLVTGWLAGGR
jgi:CrcB protein